MQVVFVIGIYPPSTVTEPIHVIDCKVVAVLNWQSSTEKL